VDSDEWRVAYIEVGMDTAYTSNLYLYAAAAKAVGASTYAYNFLYPPSDSLTEEPRVEGDWNQPWHGDDLMFVFGWPILADRGKFTQKSLSSKLIMVLCKLDL
jgi:carboxylesterase type B